MTKLTDIPVIVTSGQKYTNTHGIVAIKDGIKSQALPASACRSSSPKPAWLRIVNQITPTYEKVKQTVREHQLATVCEQAKCPNIAECWSHGTATIMLLGDICTRACRFCSVDTGNPRGWLDPNEPENAAKTVAFMALDYVVLTSVDRDDLPDGGARQYADTIRAIKLRCPQINIEALAPDFQGRKKDIQTLLDSPVDVFAQNIETVERLTHPVRDNRAGYQQTLDVLLFAKTYKPTILTKTSLMLGLGETTEELIETMDALRAHQVDILTLGQYLQPTVHHLPVIRYIPPEEFDDLKQIALQKGFISVASGPFVRSSYRADLVFKERRQSG